MTFERSKRGHAGEDRHEEEHHKSRRDFLRNTGVALGGLSLLGMPELSALGQMPDNCAPLKPTSCAPLTGTAVNFTPDTSFTVRLRKPAADLTSAEVDRLRRAVQRMCDLTNSSNWAKPIAWMQQANVHCFNCAGDARDIHNSYWFLPWHRAYLYFWERILCFLAGDKTLAIPYWNWYDQTTPAKYRVIPPPYNAPSDRTNALWDGKRWPTPTAQIPDYIVNANACQQVMVQANSFALFGGTASGGGAMEFGPHGRIHMWTGRHTSNPEDMGILATAARDPIFFCHHGCIDYLWAVWNSCNSNHVNPTWNATWMSHRWTFWDVNFNTGQPVLRSISVRDVLNTATSLRYKYNLSGNCCGTAVGAAPFTGQETRVQIHQRSVKQRVSVAPQVRTRIRSMSVAPGVAPRRAYSLVIEGLQASRDETFTVHVFADLPGEATDAAIQGPNYQGYFTFVAHNYAAAGHTHRRRPSTVTLPVSDRIAKFLQNKGDFSVTLVPVDSEEQPLDIQLTYRRLFLQEQQ